jgi:hypothetical protein
MSAPDRQRLIEEMLARYRHILERRLPLGLKKLDQIEQTVEEISQELERELEQRILEQRQAPPDNRACCPSCGAFARYRGMQERSLLTRHGGGGFGVFTTTVPPARRGLLPWTTPWGWIALPSPPCCVAN